MQKDESLLDYTNIFSLKECEKNLKVLKSFK